MAKTHEMNVPIPEGATRRWGFGELFRQSQPFPGAVRTAERQHRTSSLDDPRRVHPMRPECSFAGTLISQSVKPFHQFIEQVALLSHAPAVLLENRQFNEHVHVAMCRTDDALNGSHTRLGALVQR